MKPNPITAQSQRLIADAIGFWPEGGCEVCRLLPTCSQQPTDMPVPCELPDDVLGIPLLTAFRAGAGREYEPDIGEEFSWWVGLDRGAADA
jgi:hypothetical protein